MKSLHLSSVQPWLVNIRHKQSLQEFSVIALGSSPERAKQHVNNAITFLNDWEVGAIMKIQSEKFCATVQYAFPASYQDFINIPRS